MNKNDGWLKTSTERLSRDVRAKLTVGITPKNAEAHCMDTENPDPALTLWQRTATTICADGDTVTGAAILPKSFKGNADIPRVKGWRKVLQQIAISTRCRDTGFVFDLLLDIEFQHHQSTNGRWNTSLKRYERFAVRSVEDWCKSGINDRKERAEAAPRVSPRTFRNIKDKLVEAGLIVAEVHLWQGDNHLWIKPSEELSRMLFEPGYWQAEKAAPGQPAKAGKLKPRGLSAMRAKIAADNHDLYRKAISQQLDNLDEKMRWVVWDRLTKPQHLTGEHYSKPYAAKNSHRWKNLHQVLGFEK